MRVTSLSIHALASVALYPLESGKAVEKTMAHLEREAHPILSLLGLLAIGILLTVFGGTVWTAPLEILIVFFHEAAHALMTLLTGGRVLEMAVTIHQGGHVISAGGNRFLILTAGYLGSLLIGAALLVAGMRSRHDRLILLCLGVLVALITALFVRNMFGLIYGLIAASLMVGIARLLPEIASDYSLRLIGVMSLLYVPADIFSDTIDRAHLHSDARMLAEEFGGTTVMWGGLWLLISLVMIILALVVGLRRRRSPVLLPPHT